METSGFFLTEKDDIIPLGRMGKKPKTNLGVQVRI